MLLGQLCDTLALDAFYDILLGHCLARLGVHEGGAEHTENVIAFKTNEGTIGVAALLA